MSMMINNNFDPGFTVSITVAPSSPMAGARVGIQKRLEQFLRELCDEPTVEALQSAVIGINPEDDVERWDGLS
jgi:hypothetical protein